MGPEGGHNVKISDVVKVLKQSTTISVLDTVGPDSPQVFVGPSDLETPAGYTKFELPYLSALDKNRIERKVDKFPFFVAPLSFKPPPGYSKIPFPAPHVGSVVVANVTQNYLHEKGDHSKVYSLPPRLPPINPELPSLVNSLQDERNDFLLTPQKQSVETFLNAVHQVGLETSTERHTRNQEHPRLYQVTEATARPGARATSEEIAHRVQQPPGQDQAAAVATEEPHYLEAVRRAPVTPTRPAQLPETSTHQAPHPDQERWQQPSRYDDTARDTPTRQPQTAVRNPTRRPQHKEAATEEKEHAVSQERAETKQTKSSSAQVNQELTSKYLDSEEGTAGRQSQDAASRAASPATHATQDVRPQEPQYPRAEPAVLTEPPKLIQLQENTPIGQTQYSVPEAHRQLTYTTVREGTSSRQLEYSEPYLGASRYTTAQHALLEPSVKPSQYETAGEDELRLSKYPEPEGIDPGNSWKLRAQEDFPHRQPQHQIPQTATPENAKYTVPQDNTPHFEPQQQASRGETLENLTNYHKAQEGVLLRPEGGNGQIYGNTREEIPQHVSQHAAPGTETAHKQSEHNIVQGQTPVLQPQYQHTHGPAATTQPPYADLQDEISSGVTQYTVSSDSRFRSQLQFLASQTSTEPVLTSTATPAPERATLSRGRSRGRYRPSGLSTITPAPRTRTSHARGRRPAARTSSEAPQVAATSADQPKQPFESNRQPSDRLHAHRFEAQRNDRTRSRSRGRGTTTTTTASPQHNGYLYQEEQYVPTSTQHSGADTATEQLAQFVSSQQQVQLQAPSGQVRQVQPSNGHTGLTRRPGSEPPQGNGGQTTLNHFSIGQIPDTEIPTGSNSDELLTYTHNTNGQISLSQAPDTQDGLGQLPDRSEGERHVPVGQAAVVQTQHDKVGHSELTSGQTHSQIESETLEDYQIHSKQIAQNHISSGQVDHGKIPTRGQQTLSGRANTGQSSGRQEDLPHPAGDYKGQSAGSKRLSLPAAAAAAAALSSTEAVPLQQDGLLRHEIPEPTEETTQRQYSTLQHSEFRAQDVSPVYGTAFDGTPGQQGDPHIVTADRSGQRSDAEVTQRTSLVRIRGRIRGRPRATARPVQQTVTTAAPEVHTATAARKHANFVNRGAGRKTQTPTTTPTAETTTPTNDKVRSVAHATIQLCREFCTGTIPKVT